MSSRKADKLEKHRKGIKHRTYLNFALIALGSGWAYTTYIDPALRFALGSYAALAGAVSMGMFIMAMFIAPLMYFREEIELRSDRNPDYYLEQSMENSPQVEMLEAQGWEVKESREDDITLETYPSIVHKLLGKEKTLGIEVVEKTEDEETGFIKIDGKEIEKMHSKFKETDEGCKIDETGISLKRFPPLYLESMAFLMPELKRSLEDFAEENLSVQNRETSYSFSKFEL